MSRRRFNSFPAPSNIGTPPWTEQYLYHLDRGVKKATDCLFRREDERWNFGIRIPEHIMERRIRYIEMRKLQHKEMRFSLYVKDHPLWRRVR